MSLGNKKTYGNKGDSHPYQHRVLLALGDIIATGSTAGLATEATLNTLLNNLIASQDVEILLVRDTGNSDQVVQQIREYDEGTGVWNTRYEDVNGAAYTVVGPLEYLDPSAVLNLVLSELITLNATDFATETTLAQLLTDFGNEDFATETTLAAILADTASLDGKDFATQTTLAALLTAFNTEDFASETTLAALAATDFATQTTLADLNSKFNTLGQKASAGSHPVVLSTEQETILTAIQTAVQNIDNDLGSGGLATETTLQAIQTLITASNALLTTIDGDTSNLDVALSTRATEATLEACRVLLANLDGRNFATNSEQQATTAAINNLLTELQAKADLTETQPVSVVSLPLPLGAATAALQTTLNGLITTIDAVLDSIKVDTGAIDTEIKRQKTATSVNTTGSGSVPIGASEISFFNNGTADATVNGTPLPAGVTRTFGFKNEIDTAITYNGNGEQLLIDYMA